MNAESAITEAVNAIKSEFPSAVVEWRFGSWTCSALRSRRVDMAIIDESSGRIDPDVFSVRVFSSECGPIEAGDTVYIADTPTTVERIEPDSISKTILVSVRKAKLSP